MRRVDRGLDGLFGADAGEGDAGHLAGTFLRGVFQPELQRVEFLLLAELVNDAFDGEGGCGRAGCAVCSGLRLIQDHVIGIDFECLDVVRRKHRHRARPHRRARERPGLVAHGCLDAGQPIALYGGLELDVGATRRAAAFEHVCAAHQDLHRAPGLLRKKCGHRIEVDRQLAAESAADFHRNDLDLANRVLEHFRRQVADGEGALRARPDDDGAVRVPLCGRVVGLDVALVDHLGSEFALNDEVGLTEGQVEVAAGEPVVGSDVRGLLGHLTGHQRLGVALLAQEWSIVAHRVAHIEDGSEGLVPHLDLRERFFGDVGIDGGNGCDGVAAVEGLLAGQDVVERFLDVDGALTELLHLVLGAREVLRRDYGEHAGVLLGFAGVDGEDARVSVRAAKDAAVNQARQMDVGAVLGAASYLLHAVRADRSGTDDFVLRLFDGGHGLFRLLEFARGALDGTDDLVISGTAAEVAGEPEADSVFVGIGLAVEQSLGGHDEAWRADAALERGFFEEGLLEGVELVAMGEPFDGGYFTAGGFHRQHAARIDDAAVDEDRAGPTVAVVAAFLGAGQADFVAEHFEETLAVFAEEVGFGAVEAGGDVSTGHGLAGLPDTLERPFERADGEDFREVLSLGNAPAHVVDGGGGGCGGISGGGKGFGAGRLADQG